MGVSHSLAEMRRHYQQDGLHKRDCAACPTEQLKRWLHEAQECSPGDWFEVNAMSLATSSPDGDVTSRVVLLKGLDTDGLRFFTNYSSEKGRQLADNPRAALNFFWPHLERQVRVAGSVTKVAREVSLEYFRSRPRGSQLGAVASAQSQVVTSREVLEARLYELEAEYNGQDVPLPDDWGGYCLAPAVFEFWQGRPDRLHDRLRYSLADDVWRLERVSP